MGLFRLQNHSFKQASQLLAVTALLSNVLGLGRNLVFYRFVAPGQLDIYFASFRIADFIFNLLVFGAITSAIIPTLTELLNKKRAQQAEEVTNQLLTWISLILLVLIGLLALAMPLILKLVVHGFDAARFASTVRLSRVLLLQTIFFSWSFVIGSLLNAHRRFGSYALAPLLYNAALILGGLAAPRYGISAMGSMVIAGAFLHFFIQYVEVYKIGFHFKLDFRWSDELKEIVKLMIPRSLSQGGNQIVLLLYTSLASGLQPGSIAIFTGMNDLQTTPTVIVANSLATAALPVLTAHAIHQENQEINRVIDKLLRLNIFILLPLLALLIILRAQIVRLYFGIGGPSWQLTDIAIRTFLWFILGIIPASLVVILSRVFYAYKDTRSPMLVSLWTNLVGMAVGGFSILIAHGDVASLALAETCIAICQATAYIFILQKRGHICINLESILTACLRYVGGALLLALVSWVSLWLIDSLYLQFGYSTLRIPGLLLQTLVAGLVGLITYFGYSTIRSKEELKWIMRSRFLKQL